MKMMNARKAELERKLEELLQDREDVRAAIRDILRGKAQSYGVGTRNRSSYNMTLSELRAYLRDIEGQIAVVRSQLGGGGARRLVFMVPVDR